MSQLSAVSSGRSSGSVSSGSSSSGFMSFPAGPTSVALTAENVQRQIDNSTPSWLGEFKSVILSAMNERTAASNTAMHNFVASAISPLQDDMKALHSQVDASENRLESWTEKLAHGLDLQGKRTFELGCDVKKMGDRMAAMERAAGIALPCQSAHVDLTEDVNTVPRIHSLKRSAETAELATATEQRLARVEDALIQIVAHLKTPRSSPSSSPSSSFSSSDPSSFIPLYYYHTIIIDCKLI
jgi:hypothetical protein